MKEIELIPSDCCIKKLWELELTFPDCLREHKTYEDFYNHHKKPKKALFG